MASKIKKATFEELQETLSVMGRHVDETFETYKTKMKGKKIWDGFGSYKEFLLHVESESVKLASSELGLSDTAVRDRWHILTMPFPVYSSIEDDSITMSKAKYMTAISWDFDDTQDIAECDKIVTEIKRGISSEEIKSLVKESMKVVWHPKHVMLERLAAQHGITDKTIC